jgi:hypothetical protein
MKIKFFSWLRRLCKLNLKLCKYPYFYENGERLDSYGNDWGVERKKDEPDEDYRARILKEIYQNPFNLTEFMNTFDFSPFDSLTYEETKSGVLVTLEKDKEKTTFTLGAYHPQIFADMLTLWFRDYRMLVNED